MAIRSTVRSGTLKTKRPAFEKEIAGLKSKNEKIRARSFARLYPLSGSNPDKLYPFWDDFEEMLKSPKVTDQYYAIHLLANLAAVDKENKFKRIYDLWFNELLNHESPVVSLHIAEKSGKIIMARPEWEQDVIMKLLRAEKTSSCRHIELLKAYVLSAFDFCFRGISKKKEVIEYIKMQLTSQSPTTKSKARDLLSKFNMA